MYVEMVVMTSTIGPKGVRAPFKSSLELLFADRTQTNCCGSVFAYANTRRAISDFLL